MKRLILLMAMLAFVFCTGGCASNNTGAGERSSIRLVQSVGTPADTKVCADGRLLVFPLGHAPDC